MTTGVVGRHYWSTGMAAVGASSLTPSPPLRAAAHLPLLRRSQPTMFGQWEAWELAPLNLLPPWLPIGTAPAGRPCPALTEQVRPAFRVSRESPIPANSGR